MESNYLILGFDYDLHANQQWLGWLVEKGFPEEETESFRHILQSQQILSARVRGEEPDLSKPEATEANLQNLHDEWKRLMSADIERVISYTRATGEVVSMRLNLLAQHVINHGTYHRGEIRGLCRAKSVTDFPETDLFTFWTLAGLA